MSKSDKELQMKGMSLAMDFAQEGFEPAEAMVVLAMSLAAIFKTSGVSQHEAINRFTTVIKKVY